VQDFPLKEPGAAASPTEEYLAGYFDRVFADAPGHARAARADVLAAVRAADWGAARGHLVATVPHTKDRPNRGPALEKWGHMRLRSLLAREEFPERFREADVACQFTSVGSIRAGYLEELRESFRAGRFGGAPSAGGRLRLVYPTAEEVRWSLPDGWAAGGSIPGGAGNVDKLTRIGEGGGGGGPLWHRWQAFAPGPRPAHGGPLGRGQAMPHLKALSRYLARPGGAGAELAWFLLTSHNLSGAAWGWLQLKGTQLKTNHYEMGVLFTPATEAAFRAHPHRAFSCTPARPVTADPCPGGAPPGGAVRFATMTLDAARNAVAQPLGAPAGGPGGPVVGLPVPFPLPPTPYAGPDEPWKWDVAYLDADGSPLEDIRGRTWTGI